jgi:hypothetical protein
MFGSPKLSTQKWGLLVMLSEKSGKRGCQRRRDSFFPVVILKWWLADFMQVTSPLEVFQKKHGEAAQAEELDIFDWTQAVAKTSHRVCLIGIWMKQALCMGKGLLLQPMLMGQRNFPSSSLTSPYTRPLTPCLSKENRSTAWIQKLQQPAWMDDKCHLWRLDQKIWPEDEEQKLEKLCYLLIILLLILSQKVAFQITDLEFFFSQPERTCSTHGCRHNFCIQAALQAIIHITTMAYQQLKFML